MISSERIKELATKYQTNEINVLREYVQHLFLSSFYKSGSSKRLLFKGGTALRIVYGSPRFSEDLDFSLFGVLPHLRQSYIENLFTKVLAELEKFGLKTEIGEKFGPTSGGYWGKAAFTVFDFPAVGVEVNVSARDGGMLKGEVTTIANDFVPTYSIVHLSQEELVEEKIFGALVSRKKARDFYDLYYILRKGLLTPVLKERLGNIRGSIIADAKKVDFKSELGVFLPQDQQDIIRDFPSTLAGELQRQLM